MKHWMLTNIRIIKTHVLWTKWQSKMAAVVCMGGLLTLYNPAPFAPYMMDAWAEEEVYIDEAADEWGDLIEEEDPDEMYDPNLMSAEEVALAVQEAERQRIEERAADIGENQALIDSGFLVENADPQMILENLKELTSMESPTGSDGELLVGRYIETYMKELGYTVEEQSFHEGFLNEDLVDVPGINIIAERGADPDEYGERPVNAKDILILAAHYDSVAKPEEGDLLFNDKSGAAVLMEAARILSYVDVSMDVCFLFLSGEEDGAYGSENFVAKLDDENAGHIKGVIYVDQIGVSDDAPYVIETINGDINQAAASLQASQRIQLVYEDEESVIGIDFSDEQVRKELQWSCENAKAGSFINYFANAGFDSALLYQKAANAYQARNQKEYGMEDIEEENTAVNETENIAENGADAQAYKLRIFGKNVKEDLDIVKDMARTTDVVVRAIGLYLSR